jgi:hypothetical protein
VSEVSYKPSDIGRHLARHDLVRQVEEITQNRLRIETVFLYPDGSSIDIFYIEAKEGLPGKLSDLGQTSAWLLDVSLIPSPDLVEDILRIYKVERVEGILELTLQGSEDLIPGIIRLGQACIRVADLMYTRAYKPTRGCDPEKKGVAAFFGTWPGDETDEEIQKALDEIS